MPTAKYVSTDGREAVLEVPDTHKLPGMITIPRIIEGGTVQQYFWREDLR